MTYTTPRSCFRCGTPWSGYGNTCNACKTIDAINDPTPSVTSSTPANGDMPLPMALIIIGIFLLIDYNLNFFICKIMWLLLKVGFYLMFGWWMGIEVF